MIVEFLCDLLKHKEWQNIFLPRPGVEIGFYGDKIAIEMIHFTLEAKTCKNCATASYSKTNRCICLYVLKVINTYV